MAKRNKNGGWTGTRAGANATKSGGGPQVEQNLGELKKFEARKSPMQKLLLAVLFVLVCILAGSLIYQNIPQNMAEYWGVDEQFEQITSVVINAYPEDGEKVTMDFTSEAGIQEFCNVLDETRLKRLWFADKEGAVFTADIQIYVNGETDPAYEAGFDGDRVYFLNMPTYDWYLEEGSPLLAYLPQKEADQ